MIYYLNFQERLFTKFREYQQCKVGHDCLIKSIYILQLCTDTVLEYFVHYWSGYK